MQVGNKQILLIGDRLLIKPDNPEERTRVGLYLPQSVTEKEPVQGGRVVETGPGVAIPHFTVTGEGTERRLDVPVRFMPVQAEVGDYALFLRREAVEIRYQDQIFMVVPQSGVMLLIRGEDDANWRQG